MNYFFLKKIRSNLKNANKIAFVFRFNKEDYNDNVILVYITFF